MRNKIIIPVIIIAIALLITGCAVAEDIIYPDDGYQNITVNKTINLTNNTTNITNNTTTIVEHTQPRGWIHKIQKRLHDPFDDAPVDEYGVKTYRGELWIKNPDKTWVRVAKINKNGELSEVYTKNKVIIYRLEKHHKITSQTKFYDDYEPTNNDGTYGLNTTTLNDTNITELENNNTTDEADEILGINTEIDNYQDEYTAGDTYDDYSNDDYNDYDNYDTQSSSSDSYDDYNY